MGGAGVEQRRARRQVGQRAHEVVEGDGLVGVGRQAAGHPQEEVLGGLDHLAGVGVAQQIAVVHRAQAEELEVPVSKRADGGVQRGGVLLGKGGGLVAYQAQAVAGFDRLGEPRDVLVAHLFVDAGGQEPGGQLGVVGLGDDEAGGGADGQLVELSGGGPVGQRGDSPGGHPHRVDSHQPLGAAGHRVDDLVNVYRLQLAVALAHPHPGCAGPVVVGIGPICGHCGQWLLYECHQSPLRMR